MIKVLFITTIPSPYRVAFFNELGKLSELTVLFEKDSSDERDSSWKNYKFENFKGIIMNGKSISINTAFCPSVIKYLKKKWDEIVVCDISTPTGMLAIEYLKIKKIKYWIEGDGGFAKSGRGLKEKIKKHFISGAYGYFSTSDSHDDYYLTYGAKRKCIYRYPFTSIGENDILSAVLSNEEKNNLRKKIELTENKIVLAVGQFIERKGFDVLIKSVKSLPSDVGIYFVGGRPTNQYLQLAKNYPNIHFVGFKTKEDLKKYYLAADVFVLPTRKDVWGLVINEAMAYGLPVVTTNRCIAGLELVKDNFNGFIVSVNDDKDLADKVKICLEDENNAKFSRNSLRKIKNYTFENMTKRHMEVFKHGK